MLYDIICMRTIQNYIIFIFLLNVITFLNKTERSRHFSVSSLKIIMDFYLIYFVYYSFVFFSFIHITNVSISIF